MSSITSMWSHSDREYWENDNTVTLVATSTMNFQNGRTGTGLRGWKDLISSHHNATTILTGSNCRTDEYLRGQIILRYLLSDGALKTLKVRGWLSKPSFLYHPGSLAWSSVDNQAKAKFYGAINDAVSGFYAGPFIGELRETIRFVRKPLASVREHFNKYLDHVLGYVNGKPVARRHRPRGKRKISSFRKFNQAEKLEVVGNTWLEYRFGLRPLLHDVSEALKAIGELCGEDRVIPVYASAKSDITNFKGETRQMLWNSHIRAVVTEKSVGRVEVRYKGAIAVQATELGLKGLVQSSAHLGPRDFVPTLIELCPFSWLADYFVNISDVVGSIAIDLRPLAWYCRTVRRQVIHDVSGVPDVALMKSYLSKNFKGCAGSAGFTRITRTELLRDAPSLGLVYPEFSLPDYPIQLANLGALAAKSKAISSKLERLS